MKLFIDFLPIVLFFVAFKLSDIYVATGVLIVAAVIQTGVLYYLHKKVEKMQIITVSMILLFGGFTLLLQDEQFIKMKPTVINFLFAIILVGGAFTQKNFLERMLGDKIPGLPSEVFKGLNMFWIAFFIVAGGLNYYVAETYPTETWVNFKLFGLLGLTLAFVMLQAIYLAWYAKKNNLSFGEEESGE